MDRAMLLDHLDQAEGHVTQGEQHIAAVRERIAELTRDGHDTTLATDLLATLEESQALHVAGRDRIRAELADPANAQ
jgi:hypothetical protein